jgi:chromate transporter
MTERIEKQEGADDGRGAFAIFRVFLMLGLTSFGGPVAHLGYYRSEFVSRRRWLGDAEYADLVALGQFLPGPASSQVGFAIGLRRGGWRGGLAAWTGFTLPSAIALVLFAQGAAAMTGDLAQGMIAGLKVLAVAVVGHALLGMGRSLCPDPPRLALALAALFALALVGGPFAQVAVILAGGAIGFAFGLGRTDAAQAEGSIGGAGPSRRTGMALVGLALALLVALPLLAAAGIGGQALALMDAFYRAGALVFGGGHVVLPLLESAVVGPGWVAAPDFLAGYGATQAVPGPIFTFAAYLGAVAGPEPNGLAGAAIALVAIFLPGLLLMAGMLPFWDRLRGLAPARSVLAGVNAAVVGVLAAAFYDPVLTAGVGDGLDFALAAAAFFALTVWKLPVWTVVLAVALAGAALGGLGL